MVIRYLLVCLAGTFLAFCWGAAAWGGNIWGGAITTITAPEPFVAAIESSTKKDGAIMYPGFPAAPANATAAEKDAAMTAAMAAYKKGPFFMVLYHKEGADPADPTVFVRGFLIELFATASLAALIGLGGSGHGIFRRFMVLVAAVAFMTIGTHLVSWNFLYMPGSWTQVLMIDSIVCWMLAGLPAVIFLRSMREGDVPKEFRSA
ncbi:MAG: hypothetical protein K8R92_11370 [Planctomycetes bacterium]|nr:hypothetical protein [Planctomycetota bacterium]